MTSDHDSSHGTFPHSTLPTDQLHERAGPLDGQQPRAHVPHPAHRYESEPRGLVAWIRQRFVRTNSPARAANDVNVPYYPTERSPLLSSKIGHNGAANPKAVSEVPVEEELQGEITASGKTHNTWLYEAGTIASYTVPLVTTFVLQYLVDLSSIIAAGRIVANVSAAITCFTIFQGLATSLDTLCAQAYGSGEMQLLGLYCQRMTLFLFCLSVPVVLLWGFSHHVIVHLVLEAETARLASLYLRIIICAIPGFIVFESGKRFLQTQGLFRATTYILLIAAPFHIALIALLVLKLGFIGAPISVAITRTLLPVLLILYVRFFNGSQCWGGLSKRAFANWGTMIRLAIPDMIMIEAEWLVFEIMVIVAGRFGTDYLAAQSVLTSIGTICYQAPFPMSIAASTRVGNLIGAARVDAAKVAARVAVVASLVTGCVILIITITLRAKLPLIFTDDPAVLALAAEVMPLLGVTTFLDGLAVSAHGLLRGIGRQSIGGPANIFAHYVVSIPTSMGLAFGLGWKLQGLYTGLILGLITASIIEYTYLCMVDWQTAVKEAAARDAAG